ncbi:MAG: thioesterase family protein [Symbiobacterium sp.]|uniref:acyl-CoA thioesterase n=1 Tax=Symbiobacterium sp. TaxID=1971213 RepID=UPI003464D845
MVRTQVRVRYAETDAMGVVYHAHYLVWFEVGRNELMRAWGAPYVDFERRGILVPVTEARVRWLHPARYDDLLEVETRVERLTPARITFGYRISRAEDGRLCCEGTTTHAFLGPGGRPGALPKLAPELWALFRERTGEKE